ncbi:amidohydrolase family protein [Dissulfurispira sp.]|uniref:amidohydrolase family protein n=1 Tax=Dissulfurispira sp. TaxID=2817609 RepID=UPI002FDA8679
MDIRKIPPLIDSHIHFVVDGMLTNEAGLLHIEDELLKHGIFSVNDMGHKSGIGLEAKKILKGHLDIKSAGYAVYKKGTYGAFLGKGVAGKEEIKRVIKDIADLGADFIKLINSGVVSIEGTGFVTGGGFSKEELKVIAEEAKKMDLEIRCHANGDKAIRNALNIGVSSIEHGYFVSNETLHMMKEMDVSWTPTIYALLSFSSTLPFVERRYIEEVIENHLLSINYAALIGVKLNVGTDSGSKGVKHGESFFEELRLFQKAGLSLEQILSAACMSKDAIAEGNFLIVEKDFIGTGKIETVFSGGRQIFFRQLF